MKFHLLSEVVNVVVCIVEVEEFVHILAVAESQPTCCQDQSIHTWSTMRL